MEFQNQPFQDLRERVRVAEGHCSVLYERFAALAGYVAELERQVEELQNLAAKNLPRGETYNFTLRGIERPVQFTGGGSTKPQAIRKTEDDAGGEPLVKAVEEVQETNEG